ncbi:MAG: hypothetical protein ACRDLL_14265 [Solirubrobacterales bacterium]
MPPQRYEVSVPRELTADDCKKLEDAGCEVGRFGHGGKPGDSPSERIYWTRVYVVAGTPERAVAAVAEALSINPDDLVAVEG